MKNFQWKWQDTVSVILGLITLVYALVNYDRLPQLLPAQFGITGEVNKYWDKGSVISLLGAFGVLLPVLLQFTRSIDPKRENYRKFENAHGMIRLAISLLLNTSLALSVSYGLDYHFPAGKILIAVLGLMFMVIGNYLPQVKHNYFLGIRTPWTLASPEVWRKTHRFSGILWAIAGVLFILAVFMPEVLATTFIITGLLLSIIVPLVYSWMASRQISA
ncbi:SdpI family protein [Paenibacillus wynnii]|uniref:DUF1648 domain-containing protein n=1 Tax=Paenibacillus wynnii TaxID=268407 RepID=A0A098MEH3_9BACL|nr:SdpI family protein [Paenibacillus wynnii]KGE20950.1 hypothetical protein PWYN_01975 [Paenibacillus wynnii]